MEDAPEAETPAPVVEETPAPVAEPAPAAEGWAAEPWWEKIPEDVRPTLAEREQQYKEAMRDDAFYKAALAQDQETATLRARVTDLEKTLGTKDEELTGYRTRAEEAVHDQRARELEAKYPDIFGDFQWDGEGEATGAFVEFYKLLVAKVPEEKAARMARALIEKPAEEEQVVAHEAPTTAPAPPPAPPVKVVPPSVAAMGNGAGPGRGTVNTGTSENAEAYFTRLRREDEARERGGVG